MTGDPWCLFSSLQTSFFFVFGLSSQFYRYVLRFFLHISPNRDGSFYMSCRVIDIKICYKAIFPVRPQTPSPLHLLQPCTALLDFPLIPP